MNFMTKSFVTIIGAGLAGSEAAWQLIKRGIPVRLIEMKPHRFSPAHKSEGFAELVCSNSLRSDRLSNAVGVLKAEMRALDSLVMSAADYAKVPAGGALAVDRDMFSGFITDKLTSSPLCEVVREEVTDIPDGACIVDRPAYQRRAERKDSRSARREPAQLLRRGRARGVCRVA